MSASAGAGPMGKGDPSDPPRVAPALPAATVVLMRDAVAGLEVLLLRRSSRAGFVPGAYVFPGGRVDPSDAAPEVLARLDGLTAEGAAERLALPHGDPPAIAYYVAALREAFEETGILVGGMGERPARGDQEPGGAAAAEGYRKTDSVADQPATAADIAQVRDDLLEDRLTFVQALARLKRRVAADALEYLAHWVTPEREQRRFDTRFFAARVPAAAEPVIDAREMTAALWITPAKGIRGAGTRELPMILPTVRTLQHLATFADTTEVLEALPHLTVPKILPGSSSAPEAGCHG